MSGQMQLVESSEAAPKRLETDATAKGMLKYLSDEVGLQVLYMNSATCLAVAASHEKAAINVLCTPVDKLRHGRIAAFYTRAAQAYQTLGQ